MSTNRHIPRISIDDYPEHLNPFYEDDNHNRLRFWKKTKKLVRSNSFSLTGLNESFRELRNSIRRNVSRSRRSSVTSNEDQSSPVTLRRQSNEALLTPIGPHRLRNEYGFVIPYHEQQQYQYKRSMTPTLRSKFSTTTTTQTNVDFSSTTLPVRSHRYHFEPDVTSTPRKATSMCDHRSSQQPYALPGLATGATHNGTSALQRSSSSNSSIYANDSVSHDHSQTYSRASNISATSTLTRKKRRAPLPPNLTINKTNSPNDTADQSFETTLNTSDPIFNTPLQIIENDSDIPEKLIDESTENHDTSQTPNEIKISDTPKELPEIVCHDTEQVPLNASVQNKTEKVEELKDAIENTSDRVIATISCDESALKQDQTEQTNLKTDENSHVDNNVDNKEKTDADKENLDPSRKSNDSSDSEYNAEYLEFIDETENTLKQIGNSETDEHLIENVRKEMNILTADIEKNFDDCRAMSVKQIIQNLNERDATRRQSETTNGYKTTVDEHSPKHINSVTNTITQNGDDTFSDTIHLAKQEEYIDEIETVKMSDTEISKKIDPTTPNPIPKPKRSKGFYVKLTKWAHK